MPLSIIYIMRQRMVYHFAAFFRAAAGVLDHGEEWFG